MLSQRKEEVRRKDGFEGIQLPALFATTVTHYLQRIGVSPQQMAANLPNDWGRRLLDLLR